MLEDFEFRYEKEVVEEDYNWLIFEFDTKENEAKLINR